MKVFVADGVGGHTLPMADYETGVVGQALSPSAAAKSRVDRFLAGDWVGLWRAQEHPALPADPQLRQAHGSSGPMPVRTEEADNARRAGKAKQALSGQYCDARQALEGGNLLSPARPVVVEKLRECFESDLLKESAAADPVPDFPEEPPRATEHPGG